jgi:hypothetical protein
MCIPCLCALWPIFFYISWDAWVPGAHAYRCTHAPLIGPWPSQCRRPRPPSNLISCSPIVFSRHHCAIEQRNRAAHTGSRTRDGVICPSSDSPIIKSRWYERGVGASYAIVQHSPSCVWAVVVGVACSRSCTAVPTDPADASESGIRAAKNYVAEGGGNWTQDLGFDTMLDSPSSACPTIKYMWYGRDEETSYTIVQQYGMFIPLASNTCVR